MSDICHRLHRLFFQLPRFGFPFDKEQIPRNGIYVLFEAGELAHGGDRIVRIGTHTGKDQLPSRLDQHFVKENKDRSIFRKNIGRALLNRDADPFLAQWEVELTSARAKRDHARNMDFQRLRETEGRVTDYIRRQFRFVVFALEDKEARLYWERQIISTVSLCADCRPSAGWLGLHSPKAKIRKSGLWLVNELYKEALSESEYGTLEKIVLGKVHRRGRKGE